MCRSRQGRGMRGIRRERSSWTLDAAKALLEVVYPICAGATLNLVKYYIAIEVNRNNYLWMHKRGGGKSLLGFWVSERLLPQATETLDAAGIPYIQRNQDLKITVDQQDDSHKLRGSDENRRSRAEVVGGIAVGPSTTSGI